jgi:hypothetical protein
LRQSTSAAHALDDLFVGQPCPVVLYVYLLGSVVDRGHQDAGNALQNVFDACCAISTVHARHPQGLMLISFGDRGFCSGCQVFDALQGDEVRVVVQAQERLSTLGTQMNRFEPLVLLELLLQPFHTLIAFIFDLR